MFRVLSLLLRGRRLRGSAVVLCTALGISLGDCTRAADEVHDFALYYLLGGGRATDAAAAAAASERRLRGQNLAPQAACGAFQRADDIVDMLSARLEESLTALTAVPQAVSSALPGSVLCRARPGLCQLLQHYVVRAENRWNLSVDECRQDFAALGRAGTPEQDLFEAARTEVWQRAARDGASAATAKRDADSADGCVEWLGGTRAGCQGADAIWLLHDTARAGWCLLLNQSGGCQGVPSGDAASNEEPLVRTWRTPAAAGDWVVQVLGDYRIQAGEAVETIAGRGLLPKIDQRTAAIRELLAERVYNTEFQGPSTQLELPEGGLVLGAPLISALRELPDRDFLINRVANEAALAKTVEQAFLARRMLLSGLMEPHIQRAGALSDTVVEKIAVLEREVDRASWEMQARRQIVSATVLEILAAYRVLRTPVAPSRSAPKQLLR